ncbi:chorismate mutase [Delphinella strobiligena]|nr:chorismate mutase [Delphinella strobiligena]
MDTAIDLSDASKALDLANIRFQLIRLEDTITFHLIERVQFPLNPTIYRADGVKIPHEPHISLLDWMLREHERLQSLVRRYQAPDEYPFFPDVLQTPVLAPIKYPQILHPNDVTVNDRLKECYISHILPAACAKFGREERGEAQENYGSAATCDVLCLQALSRRIHFGKFVAESKFRKETERFVKMIQEEDRKGIDEAITNAAVEQKVLERLRLKAKTYGTDPSLGAEQEGGEGKIDVEAVVAMYKDYVIPLTKVVEVEYLMQRLKGTEWE